MYLRLLKTILLPCLLLAVSVPAFGMDEDPAGRSAREKRFINELLSLPDSALMLDEAEEFDMSLLKEYDKKNRVYLYKGPFYQIESLNGNTFYVKQGGKKGVTYDLVMDPDYAAESMANLLVAPADIADSIPVNLSIQTHGYNSKADLPTNVMRLVSYCINVGCQPYFGVIHDNPEGNSTYVLYMVNPQENYLHVFPMECNPRGVIDNFDPINMRAYLFVPTDNIKTLYQELPKGLSKAMQKFQNQPIQ